MEGGIGSRTGRPSSRYGSAPVFTGPVRRWQKQWVHMSQSSSSSVTNYNNINNNNKDNVSAVRVRRWTPVQEDKEDGEDMEDRPRRRKIRYAPIVVLEGKKKEAEKGDDGVKEVSKTNKSISQGTLENEDDEKKSLDKVLAAKTKASEKNVATEDLNSQPLDLDMDMGDEEDRDLGGAHKVADWVKAAQRGFAH
ncbi:hypothetical protein Tco_0280352 [Tanacetum coccineum]